MPAPSRAAEPLEKSAAAEDPLGWLAPAERYAYDYFVPRIRRGGADTYPLAEEAVGGMFELYLRGRSLREIHQLNRHRFSLGQVVFAAAEFDWPRRRRAAMDDILDGAKERVQQAAADAAGYIADTLAAASLIRRKQLEDFLRGDTRAIPKSTASPAVVKAMVEALGKLTGADRTSRVAVSGSIVHSGIVPPVVPQPQAAPTLAAWSQQAQAKKKG